MINVFLERIDNLLILGLREISSLLNQIEKFGDYKSAFMKAKCDSTKLALYDVLKRGFIFFVIEHSLIEFRIKKPSFCFLIIKTNGLLKMSLRLV